MEWQTIIDRTAGIGYLFMVVFFSCSLCDIAEAISMSDEIVILSNRPAVLIKIMALKFEENFPCPLKRREAPNFRIYFNEIWKELNSNANSK
ncbi:MAG: NitT/TauT family transport system ATP-binding protein [Clostridium sp.]|jgi:NitT/TauT family transport system ATP-binding protein